MSKLFSSVTDPRKRREYSMEEILTGALGMFLLRQGSRNSINNNRFEGNFAENFERLFACRLPHQDTVSDVLREVDSDEFEEVKMQLAGNFFEQKFLRPYRLFGKYYLIAVDATGVVSFDHPHCEHCLVRETKNTTKWYHYVLEAKLVTENGLCISLATEWIENPSGEYDKQDCERKAFARFRRCSRLLFPAY